MSPAALRVRSRARSARLFPERQVGLRCDVIGAAEQVEVVDIGGAEIGLDRVGDAGDRHAELLRLDAVDIDEHLRRVGGERREHRGEARRLARGVDQFVGGRRQQLRTAALAVLDPHGEAAAGADARHGGRRNDDDEGALDGRQALAQLAGDRAADSPFFSRASGSSNTGNSAAALPACVRVAPEKPANAATRMMPGISSAMRSISRTISVVRASEAAPGNCTEMMT